ncbi:MAG: NmrA family transcriptional regulator [Anaerolineae bacterium]|nr:MAG: NmrA family transcriptional regulator [Anaerolineae bacterium]
MKITIFGASSASGKLTVEKALQAGHEVTAFVRNANKLAISHEKLTTVTGDALHRADVERAVRGSQAVISLLGPKGKPTTVTAQSTRHIVTAMQTHRIQRLVVVSVAGIAVPQDQRGFNLISTLLKILLKDIFHDREEQLAILAASNLDWIAVRVPRLTNEPPRGNVRAFFGNPSPSLKLSRADLADFLLAQLTENRWVRQAPIIANGA